MRRFTLTLGIALVLLVAIVLLTPRPGDRPPEGYYARIAHFMEHNRGKVPKAERRPSDWFYVQRAYPQIDIPMKEYVAALETARAKRADRSLEKDLDTLTWSEAGPTNIPGRITDIAVHPSEPEVIYAASAAGGVFKSTNFGTSWSAVFDDAGTQSIGAIAIHPDNPDILYVGTGEANGANDTYDGTGVYKSIDAGATWNFVGLPESYRIGRIVIDPDRPDTIFVAVQGKLFGTNPERGVYRSQDGGQSWEHLLFVNDSTGCIDIALHPTGVILAATWECWRNPVERRVGGFGSGIWHSGNFGDSWTLLDGAGFPGNGLPLSSSTVGRIGVTIDPFSNHAYATYCDHPGSMIGLFHSTDLGFTWTQTNDGAILSSLGGFGWYFGQVRVAPGSPTVVYSLGVTMYKSIDEGANWFAADAGTHVDHHALYIDPTDIDNLYNGCDGGVNYSDNGGSSFANLANMPNTQYYAIGIDHLNPHRLYGGTQDNGTMRTLGGSLNDWTVINGGDGFYVLVDYTDANKIYAEYQNGVFRRSTNGGLTFMTATSGMNYSGERHNWNTPFAMDPVDPLVLYYGSNILYQTTNGAVNWTAISGDLTDGPGGGNLAFGTITTIDVSPANTDVIWVGTDDANVWVTQDGGDNWAQVNAGLPNRWVTRVAPDPHSASIAYVTFSGYKDGSYLPHIFRTVDYGQNWDDITGDLGDVPINDVIVDPDLDSTLYLGSDVGVYYSEDLGAGWLPLGTGMPITPVHDLAYDDSTRTLVAGTHGRSMFKLTLPSGPTCTCPCHTDPQCDSVTNVFDVVKAVDVGFRSAPPVFDLGCPREHTDANCDGVTNVFDVVAFVEVAFRSGDPATVFCDPCGI